MSSRYQYGRLLGEGGFGTVHFAFDLTLDRPVAIKRLTYRSAESSADEELRREGAILASVQHPALVQVYDMVISEAGAELVMEYIDGVDLKEGVPPALDLPTFLEVAIQLSDGMAAAHDKKILHLDVKPGNIMISHSSGQPVAKILDFGLATLFDGSHQERPASDGSLTGSVHFMAPERFALQPLDHRSDLYSLGCVFYFCLTGHSPYEGETVNDVISGHLNGQLMRPLSVVRPDVPLEVGEVIGKMMRVCPEDRYGSGRDVSEALREIQQSLSTPSAVETGVTTGSKALPDRASTGRSISRVNLDPLPLSVMPVGAKADKSARLSSLMEWAAAAAVVLGASVWWAARGQLPSQPTSSEPRATNMAVVDLPALSAGQTALLPSVQK